MNSKHNVTYDEMINEIRRYCEKTASGMFFFSGDNGCLAQVGLKEGKIVLLSCLKKQGMDAIPLIRQIQSGWFRFATMEILEKSVLHSTADILAALSEELASPSEAATTSEILDQKKVEILQDILAEYIGPIALLFCGQLNGVPLESALDTLAKEITNPQHAKQFKEKARQHL